MVNVKSVIVVYLAHEIKFCDICSSEKQGANLVHNLFTSHMCISPYITVQARNTVKIII